MADDSDDETRGTRIVSNQPYDESLEVPDAEEVASLYTPSPRLPGPLPGLRDRSPAMTEQSDDFETGPMENKMDDSDLVGDPMLQPISQSQLPLQRPEGSEDEDDDEEDDDDDDDDDDSGSSDDEEEDEDNVDTRLEGAYDPAEYENLAVTSEIKELFQYITRYTPQSIDLDTKLKPFIPDYIPAVGDIDAFIKVLIPRADGQDDSLGLTVLDEPCAKQSDPTVLDLQLRAISKQTTTKAMQVRSINDASKNPKLINNWIESISDLHRSKPPPTVHYTKTMPEIDDLMQEWPPEFEEMLKTVGLPTADIDCDLAQYVDMICAILDIPIYQSKIQALHVIFTLYSEFKNSQHFKSLAEENKLDNALKRGAEGGDDDEPDRLVL